MAKRLQPCLFYLDPTSVIFVTVLCDWNYCNTLCRGMKFTLCRDNHFFWMPFRFLKDDLSHRGTHWASFWHLLLTPLASHCLCRVGSVLWPVRAELCGQEAGYVMTACSELQGRAVGSWEEQRDLGESTWSWVCPHQGVWGSGGRVLGRPSPKASRILPLGCCCHLLSGRIYSQAGLLSIEAGCPGSWWSHPPWRCSRNDWTGHWVLWSGWQGWSKVGLDDLGVFPNLNDSVCDLGSATGPSWVALSQTFIFLPYFSHLGIMTPFQLKLENRTTVKMYKIITGFKGIVLVLPGGNFVMCCSTAPTSLSLLVIQGVVPNP